MKKRNMRGYVAGLALVAGLCITQGIPAHAATEAQSDSGTSQSYETADPSKGVSYVKNDLGNTMGINLNGNSAVIRMSENSTSDKVCINIYNDKNRNGKVDDGETAFTLDGSADIIYSGGMPIYGLYQQKYDKPMAITVDGVDIGCVKGIYESLLDSESNSRPALKLQIMNSVQISAVVAAEKSQINGDVEVSVGDGCELSSLVAAQTASISGNASVNLNGSSYGVVQILNEGSEIQKDLDITFKDITFKNGVGSSGASSGCKVLGNVNFDADGVNTESSSNVSFAVLDGANCSGDLNVTLKNYTGSGWTFYGSKNNSYVKRNLDVQILGGSGTFDSIYGTMQTVVEGTANIQIKDCNCKGAIFGDYSGVFLSRKNPADGMYAADISINGCTAGGIVYGQAYAQQVYSLKVDITNVDAAGCNIYGFQSGTTNVMGQTDISISDCKGSLIYGYNGYNSESQKDEEILTVTLKKCIASVTLYGVNQGYFGNDCILHTSENIFSSYTGFSGITVEKNAVLTSTHENDSSIQDANGDPLIDSCSFAANGYYDITNGITVKGNFTVEMTGVSTNSLTAVGSSYLYGDSKYTIKDSEITGRSSNTLTFVDNISRATENTTTVLIDNTDFSAMSSLSFNDRLAEGQTLIMTVKDNCKLPVNYYVTPNKNQTGSAVVTVGNDVYYGGIVTLKEDVTADNIYFGTYANYNSGYATVLIPENVVVTANENIYIPYFAKVLNKGTLTAKAVKNLTSSSESKIYLNGGTIQAEKKEVEVYYPISLEYNEKAGRVSTSSYETISLESDVYYGKNGQTISVYPSYTKGYKLVSVVLKKSSETQSSELAATSGGYSFDMPDEPITVIVTFAGNQITLKKTAADPCAVLNTTYTADNPLYDLTRLMIFNDAAEGTVEYAEDTVYTLPEGLKIEDGKIVGTPSALYEDGKRVDIHVTAKNGTEAVLKFNVIVSTKQQMQESTAERLTIDEENKEICLNGTSAVIQQTGTMDDGTILTGIFADDDLDGKADGKQAMYSGDMSEYTIYGISGIESWNHPIKITVLSGTVGTIYGESNAAITYPEKNAVILDLQGGTAGNVYGMGSGSVDGYVYIRKGENATASVSIKDSSTYSEPKGSLFDNNGVISIGKNYHVYDKISAASIKVEDYAEIIFDEAVELTGTLILGSGTKATFNSSVKADKFAKTGSLYAEEWFYAKAEFGRFAPGYSWVHIEKTATLTADTIQADNSSGIIYLKGVVSAKNCSNKAKWIVAGTFGAGTDISDWSNLYFKITASSNLGIDPFNYADYCYSLAREDGDGSDYFLCGNIKQNVKYKDIAGYTAVLSLNDGEAVEGTSGRCLMTIPQEEMTLYVSYIPKQISCKKLYADPVVVKETEYTTADPAYDLSQIKIENDTTAQYGSAKKYKIKEGSKLPEGLTLDGDQVVGTLADTAETTETTFRITGRNGSVTECKILFTVEEAGYKVTDLNEELDVKAYNDINLKGHSIVILPDESDSTGKKVSIYPDDDHDGIADNGKVLKIAGASSYDLSSRSIYGYRDTTPYEGDITIYMYGGSVGRLYGAKGSSKNESDLAQVDGTVGLFIKGGQISYETAVAYYADVKKAELHATGGKMYQYVYGLNIATADELIFQFTDQAQMAQTPFGETYTLRMTEQSTVKENAAITVGASDGRYAFVDSSGKQISGKSSAYGFSKSTVNGNVNYDVIGNWQLGGNGTNIVSYDSEIKGDLNVLINTNSYGVYGNDGFYTTGSLVKQGSVNNINVTDKTGANGYVLAANCTLNNVRVKRTVSGSIRGKVTYLSGKCTINESFYAEDYIDKKLPDVCIGGIYTIDKDISARDLKTLDGAAVTITDGVSVDYTGDAELYGTLINNGTFICKGDKYSTTALKGTFANVGEVTLWSATALTIDSSSVFINKEDASFWFGNMENSGTIINDGVLQQGVSTTAIGNGVILTSKIPEMRASSLASYSTIYYKAELVYPEFCFEDATERPVSIAPTTASYMKTSGIEGDDSIYIKGGAAIKVTVSGTPVEGLTVDAITYKDGSSTMTKQNETSWIANMPYAPDTFTINMKNDTATVITLDKTEDTVDTAVVGVTTTADKPLYDLTALKIANDIDSENAKVVYSLANESVLPSGLELKNGKIYGTPKKASETEQTVTIKICGKNQTVAAFKLTFTKVAKGTPVMETPDICTGVAGKTLESVTLPTLKLGTYEWADAETVITKAGTEAYDAYFVPEDTANYDWSKADIAEDAYEVLANGSVRIKVKITVKADKQIPTYTVPTDLKGTYGQTLADVTIPKTEDGTFAWVDDSASLGTAGSHSFKAVYTPKNGDIYEVVEDITITVTVEPAKPEFKPELDAITVKQGTVLGDVELPDVEGGYYYWDTAKTTVINETGDYKVCYKPNDITNYDWTEIDGWNNAHKGIILSVRILVEDEHAHTFVWKSDATKHWKECTCGDKTEAEEHTFNAGEITKASTTTETGIKTYECTVCGYQKQEILPKKEETPDPTPDPNPDKPNPTPDPDKPNPVDPNPGTPEITDISEAVVSGIVNKAYTGKAQVQFKLMVSLGGKVLTAGKDYAVTYKNNKNAGKATITIKGQNGYTGTLSKTFNITIGKGKTYVVKNVKYKVTKASTNGKGTVTVTGSSYKKTNKKFKTLKLGKTVKIGGISYKITAVDKNAFKGCGYLKSVTIGDNITAIGNSAFEGCKALTTVKLGKGVTKIGGKVFYKAAKLKNITITSKKIKSVGKNAFNSIHKKPVVKLPKSKYTKYVNLLKKAKMPSKVTYKKTK